MPLSCENYTFVIKHSDRTQEQQMLLPAKRWALGCVNALPLARGGQEAGFTQPRAHLIAQLCTRTLVKRDGRRHLAPSLK